MNYSSRTYSHFFRSSMPFIRYLQPLVVRKDHSLVCQWIKDPSSEREGSCPAQFLRKLRGGSTLLSALWDPPSKQICHSFLSFPNKYLYCPWLGGCHFVFLIYQVLPGQKWFWGKNTFPNSTCIINLKIKPVAVMPQLKIILRCMMTLAGNWQGT